MPLHFQFGFRGIASVRSETDDHGDTAVIFYQGKMTDDWSGDKLWKAVVDDNCSMCNPFSPVTTIFIGEQAPVVKQNR